MTRRRALLGAALAVVIVVLWWGTRPQPRRTTGETTAISSSRPPAPSTASRPAGFTSKDSPASQAEESRLADELNAPGGTIEADLRVVLSLLEAFRTSFPREGNPVGSNPEITAALQGRNPASVAFVPRGHRAVNAAGELCDRWGTPFFFHAESARRMEVRSAGPDRRLWTEDDILQSP
ncbi:MAG: hypothetical protein ACKODK_03290 [Opitutaceae bacterium]